VNFVYAFAAAVFARMVLHAVVPLVHRRPWIVDGRADAALLAGALMVGGAIDLMRLSSATGTVSTGASGGFVVALTFFAALIVWVAMRGHTVNSVRDDDFREALKAALQGGGYPYDVLVDASERPSIFLLGGQWEGVEVTASSRGGIGTVRGKGVGGRVVERDLVQRMRDAFSERGAEPHRAVSVQEIAMVCVFVGIFVFAATR